MLDAMRNPGPARAPQAFPTTRYTLDSPPTGEHFAFATSSRSGDGKFRFVWTLAPGKRGPGEHVHPVETERFEVVEGTLRVWLAGEPRDLGPGQTVDVKPGTPHRFLNPAKVPCVVNVTLDGPRMEDTFMPLAVANAESPRFSNLLRFIATTPKHRASIPTSRVFNAMALPLIGLLGLFGIRAYEPVFGWDRAT